MTIVKHFKKEDYTVSSWSGGKTIQLAIAPGDAVYADRDFLWRLSSATVELEESDFTALPDYNRWITPLKGDMVLSHNEGPEIDLQPYQVHAFDGADRTHSRGCCTDFNLMLRKGRCGGLIEELSPASGTCFVPRAEAETLLLYCSEGSVNAAFGGNVYLLQEGESLLIERGPANEKEKALPEIETEFHPGGRVMAAQMWRV